MSDRIFFKDDENSPKGPYTERQVQEFYRQKWFDTSVLFYFTQTGLFSMDLENGGISLDSLRSRNGIGCPFINFDENGKSEFKKNRTDREEKLAKIEKEIALMYEKLSGPATASIKNTEQAERQDEVLTSFTKKSDDPKPEEKTASKAQPVKKPDQSKRGKKVQAPVRDKKNPKPEEKVVPVQKVEQSIEEIGNVVATYVLDALNVYASGDFGSWEKGRTQKIESMLVKVKRKGHKETCESILVERMKQKDFFCCDLCQTAFFNHKQALIHFSTADHRKKETSVAKSGAAQFRRVLAAFTKLPSELDNKDMKAEVARFRQHGVIDERQRHRLRPLGDFIDSLLDKYVPLVFLLSDDAPVLDETRVAVDKLKGPVGHRAMTELHEHLEKAKTHCGFCGINTGDREKFYAHLISSLHMEVVTKAEIRNEFLTMLVNVSKKDLI